MIAVEEQVLTSRVAEAVCEAANNAGRSNQFIRADDGRDVRASAYLSLKPSIAVLPFDYMSKDSDQEYFSDGITEDIITELTKFQSLFVIARNSSFAFKGQATDVKQLGEKLGVRYIVEGSVRRAGNRIRITVQLIDAVEDKHIWAERYDRDLEDIFAVQDEVTFAIVTSLEPQLAKSERKRALRKPPESLDTWESYQRGLWHMYQCKAEDRDVALGFFLRAIELDPTFGSAHAGYADALYTYVLLGASPDREADLARAFAAGKTAVRLDGHDSFAWATVARGYVLRREPALAIVAADNAILYNPNSAMAHFACGHALWHSGRPAEAILLCDEAMRLSPYDPLAWAFMGYKASALVMLGQFEEAIAWSRRAQRQVNADVFSHLAGISAFGHLGRHEEAGRAIKRAQQTKLDISISYEADAHPITDPRFRDMYHEGLRKAGMPE